MMQGRSSTPKVVFRNTTDCVVTGAILARRGNVDFTFASPRDCIASIASGEYSGRPVFRIGFPDDISRGEKTPEKFDRTRHGNLERIALLPKLPVLPSIRNMVTEQEKKLFDDAIGFLVGKTEYPNLAVPAFVDCKKPYDACREWMRNAEAHESSEVCLRIEQVDKSVRKLFSRRKVVESSDLSCVIVKSDRISFGDGCFPGSLGKALLRKLFLSDGGEFFVVLSNREFLVMSKRSSDGIEYRESFRKIATMTGEGAFVRGEFLVGKKRKFGDALVSFLKEVSQTRMLEEYQAGIPVL